MSETIYSTGIPKKNKLLQFIFSFNGLCKLFPFHIYIRTRLKKCINISWSAGFQFLYGNITAKNAGLSDTIFLDYENIYIGENTNFGWGNIVITSTHDPKNFNRIICKPIYIGSNVFITSRCIILPGVKIGNGSIIGAGTVVTKDVPAKCIFAGNPGKVIKFID